MDGLEDQDVGLEGKGLGPLTKSISKRLEKEDQCTWRAWSI